MEENEKAFKLTDNQKFMVQQIENTVAIIEEFKENKALSYTALQNALLSLVVMPYESVKQKNGKRIWEGSYKDFQNEIGFNEIEFSPITSCNEGILVAGRKTQYSFIRKFRNAIAHQNVEIKLKDGEVSEIVFFNVFVQPCRTCTNQNCQWC